MSERTIGLRGPARGGAERSEEPSVRERSERTIGLSSPARGGAERSEEPA